jgi:hypothetical protein
MHLPALHHLLQRRLPAAAQDHMLKVYAIIAAVAVAAGFGGGFLAADHLAAGRIERLAQDAGRLRADRDRETARADANAAAERQRAEICRRSDDATTTRDHAVDDMDRRLQARQREIDDAATNAGDDALDRAVGGGVRP